MVFSDSATLLSHAVCVCVWVDKVVAVYAYQAQHDDDLSFAVNDIITIVDRSGSDWWRGELRGQTGMFPSNYVAAVAVPEHVNSELSVASAMHRMYLAVVWCVSKLRMCELEPWNE